VGLGTLATPSLVGLAVFPVSRRSAVGEGSSVGPADVLVGKGDTVGLAGATVTEGEATSPAVACVAVLSGASVGEGGIAVAVAVGSGVGVSVARASRVSWWLIAAWVCSKTAIVIACASTVARAIAA